MTAQSAKPIIFSAPMVRAILREIEAPGTGKTMTRRVLTPQPEPCSGRTLVGDIFPNAFFWPTSNKSSGGICGIVANGTHPPDAYLTRFPLKYAPGDQLWIRETWCLNGLMFGADSPAGCLYRADSENDGAFYEDENGEAVVNRDGSLKSPWRSPIHMPRWASRITLIVTDVRVERLQDISEADAIAEGVEHIGRGWDPHLWLDYQTSGDCNSARLSFNTLWDSINAKRDGGKYSWAANPWVAAYTFRPILGNIDQINSELR